ncbi:MAG: glycosyltransferase family 4 protein [Betaproteobacteria bacterium]|nr:glycosyltransferase family 4 protein [Betaproteobacteria bacterium]
MSPIAIITIVSSNYLHFARTLMQSAIAQHPEADRYCLIVDLDSSHANSLSEEFQVLELCEIGLPDGDDFLFQYNILELNTAVKPWAIAALFARGYRHVLYIDPDIFLYRPLAEVIQAFQEGAEIILTPHLLSPVTDEFNPDELDIRRSGTYNLGFCGLAESANTHALLKWWQVKLRRECIIAHDRGIFVDQSWMDLVPGLFSNVFILRHPGYNVAYWNLAQRSIESRDEMMTVNGFPLVFFHFSGLNPTAPQSISKHQNRFVLEKLPAVTAKLIEDYCAGVIANGLERYQKIPYGFGSYADGTPILDAERTRFRNNDELRLLTGGQPFSNKNLLRPAESEEDIEPYIKAVYAHLLGRLPDRSGQKSYASLAASPFGRLRLLLSIALSREARARAGWLQRLFIWSFRNILPVKQQPPAAKAIEVATPAPQPEPRRSPYSGLYPAEPDSAENGLWIGPRLDLPTFEISRGEIEIQGIANLALLKRGSSNSFALEVYVLSELVHREEIESNGLFCFTVHVEKNSFYRDSQWTILASTHVVPKEIGLSSDDRQLSWRLKRISVDGIPLLDCSRSPITFPLAQLYAPTGVNLVGYLYAELGLGEALRSLASACSAVQIPFSTVDVGYQSSNLQRDQRLIGLSTDQHFPVDLLYVNADQTKATLEHLKINQSQTKKPNHKPSRYRIGIWHWEQQRLPDSALSAFAYLDEIWVSSTFVHDAVAPLSPLPVVKIPLALDFAPSLGVSRSDFGLPEDKTLVLVMYDFHSYQYRKNPQAAVAAFRVAAANRDDAILVLKTINSQSHAEERAELARQVSGMRNVIFIDDFLTRQQTWDLQSCCDILLSLHRAEGFGLALAEMMYLGKPVIGTGWSANMDFMTAENSFPVSYTLKPLEHAVGVYVAGQPWAEVDVAHAARLLQNLLDDPELRTRIGKRAAQDIRRQLSPAAVGKLVKERLSLLNFWHPQWRL